MRDKDLLYLKSKLKTSLWVYTFVFILSIFMIVLNANIITWAGTLVLAIIILIFHYYPLRKKYLKALSENIRYDIENNIETTNYINYENIERINTLKLKKILKYASMVDSLLFLASIVMIAININTVIWAITLGASILIGSGIYGILQLKYTELTLLQSKKKHINNKFNNKDKIIHFTEDEKMNKVNLKQLGIILKYIQYIEWILYGASIVMIFNNTSQLIWAITFGSSVLIGLLVRRPLKNKYMRVLSYRRKRDEAINNNINYKNELDSN